MTDFTLLMLVNLGLVAVALLRSRPGTLLIAFNQIGVLRALSNISLYGRPASEEYLPISLFTPEALAIATRIFAVATAVLAASLLVGKRTAPRDPKYFPPVPRLVLGFLAIYIAGLTFTSGNLQTESYTNEGGNIFGISLGGLNALVFSVLLYELLRRALVGDWRPRTAFLVLAIVLFATSFSKGSTGLATGYGIVAAIMLWPASGRLWSRRTAISVLTVVALVLVAYVIRGVRQGFYERGLDSISQFLADSEAREADTSRTGQGLEAGSNGTQYASHVLECIQLHETGISRSWRSIYNPLVYTFEPSFLLSPLELTRPEEAPWELARYYIHGGGVYLLGELYWNGGYFCVFVVFSLLILLIFLCDTKFANGPVWLMFACSFTPGLLMGIGYGFAQTIRGAINGLLIMAGYRLTTSLGLSVRKTARRARGLASLRPEALSTRHAIVGADREARQYR